MESRAGTLGTILVAELSANHNQRLQLALDTIAAAKECGADAIKVQTYTPDTMTIDSREPWFIVGGGTPWDGQSLYELYRKAYTPWEWHEDLKRAAERAGLLFFSTPFDRSSADFLEKLGVPMYKIASFELNDTPFVEYVARKGKPMILATGLADLQTMEAALAACRRAGNTDITLLKCTSAYPAPFEEVNLRTMVDMQERFRVRVGVSDHTPGIAVPVAAAALGASMIEKHFILDRRIGGPDASFSLEPAEFQTMAQAIRQATAALGTVTYDLTPSMRATRVFARSLFVVRDMHAGDLFTPDNVRSIRPGCGMDPARIDDVIGKRATRDISRGTPLTVDMVEDLERRTS